MKRQLMWGILAFASCSRPEPPRTTGFATKDHAEAKLGDLCKSTDRIALAMNNGNPVESRQFWRQWCELALDKDQQRVWGDAVIELQGDSRLFTHYCGVHIGPAIVNNPVPPTILERFIDEPALASELHGKLAAIDASREYSYQERVAGFQLDVVQQYGRSSSRGELLVIDLRMNGCDQYPDASPPALKVGRSVTVH